MFGVKRLLEIVREGRTQENMQELGDQYQPLPLHGKLPLLRADIKHLRDTGWPEIAAVSPRFHRWDFQGLTPLELRRAHVSKAPFGVITFIVERVVKWSASHVMKRDDFGA